MGSGVFLFLVLTNDELRACIIFFKETKYI